MPKRKGGWIKAKMGETVEDGQSKIINEKRHVALLHQDGAGQIEASLAHVGVRVESRAERRYRKR